MLILLFYIILVHPCLLVIGNSELIKIGRVKSFVQKGQRVTVYFDSGKSGKFVAQTDITSTLVAVMGDYAFSEDVANLNLSTTQRLFKSKTTPLDEESFCTLVAASFFRSRISLVNYGDPYDISPFTTRVMLFPYTSWVYDEDNHLCQAVQDGSGQYDTEAECRQANNFDKRIQFGINNLSEKPYHIAPNGDLAFRGVIGYEETGTFIQSISVRSAFELENTNLWYKATYTNKQDGSQLIQSQSFTDGSIKIKINNNETSFTGAGYNFSNSPRPEHLKETIAGFGEIQDLPRPEFRATYDQLPNLDSNIWELQKEVNSFFWSIAYFRTKVATAHQLHQDITTFFIKIHDPDLPSLKVYSYPTNQEIRPYFIFQGIKAYLILKIGKIRNPDVSYAERSWYQIIVMTFDVTQTELIKTSETTYNPGDTVNLPDLIINPKLVNFVDEEIGHPCLDIDDYYIRFQEIGFREVNLQKAPGAVIIEYKVPGRVVGID